MTPVRDASTDTSAPTSSWPVLCEQLGMESGGTYAQGVRSVGPPLKA